MTKQMKTWNHPSHSSLADRRLKAAGGEPRKRWPRA